MKRDRRKRRRAVLLVAVLFVGVAAREVYLALTARPGPTVDSHRLLNELVWEGFPGVARSDNAWPELVELGEELRRTREAAAAGIAPNGEPAFLLYEAIYETPEDVQRRVGFDAGASSIEEMHAFLRGVARTAMERNRSKGAFERTARLAEAKALVRPEGTGYVFETELPGRFVLRQVWRLQKARFHAACSEGDDAEAVRAVRESLALARLTSFQAFGADRSFGETWTLDVLRDVRDALAQGRLSPAVCREVMRAIGDEVRMPSPARAVEAERLCSLDLVQWTHTGETWWRGGRRIESEAARRDDWAHRDPALHVEQGAWGRLANVRAVWLPRKGTVDRAVHRYFDAAAAAAELAGAERREALVALESRRGSFGIGGDEYVGMVLPQVRWIAIHEERCTMEAAGTRLALAIEVFRAERGRVPAALDELVPGVLAGLPRDMLASDGGFRYRLVGEPDGPVTGYLLYSVGLDGKDNDGNTDPNDPFAALWWREGFDFVISAPRTPGTRDGGEE